MLTAHGKRMLAFRLYRKGMHFILAAILLKKQDGNRLVVFHLLCQGYEIVLKGILLMRDYDCFAPRLRRLGHSLTALASATTSEFGLHPLSGSIAGELADLSQLYAAHQLRYQSHLDLFLDASSIPGDRVFRRMVAVVCLTEREIRNDPRFSTFIQRTDDDGTTTGVRWGSRASS